MTLLFSSLPYFGHLVDKILNKSLNFHSFTKEYLNIGSLYNDESDLKAVYVGSDMVFDIWEGYNPYMYGKGICSPYIFSYAASFGYTTTKLIQESGHGDEIVSYLSTFKEIGYRDQNTCGICKELGLTVPMTETIDPVLCYGFEKEVNEWDTGNWRNKKYILIYAYDSTMNDKETVDVIRRYAKEAGLLVVSCGYYHDWCDICVPASPTEFLEMFKHAKYIVTDTFHGTVFSLILHKQFASIIRNNGFKIEYLLKSSSMESRIARTPVDTMTVATSSVSYDLFDYWLQNERKASLGCGKGHVKPAFDVSL